MNYRNKLRVLVSGYVIRRPVGGLAWHYMHYVIGLARMGHDVFYIEDSEDYPCCFDPLKAESDENHEERGIQQPFERLSWHADYGLQFATSIFNRIGLPENWAYYDARTRLWCGPGAKFVEDRILDADILLNISNSIPVRPWLRQVPSRVLIDTDPVFGQVRHIHVPSWLERTLQHNVFLTFGENFKVGTCTIPDDGLPWKSTRQPVVLDEWEFQDRPRQMKFSTVMSWKSYDPAKNEGVEYGLKSDSFSPFIDLPSKTDVTLELAIDSSKNLREMLLIKGWNLLNALDVTQDPWSYQEYVQKSAAEFSVAKQAYVVTKSGWFSERSAAYLASGRPVLTQDTGFSEWLGTEGGVFAFNTSEEALAGIERICSDYRRQSLAARQVAEQFFSHHLVLSDLLEKASHPDDRISLESSVAGSVMFEEYKSAVEVISRVIAPECSFILIDDNQWGAFGIVEGRKCYPFLERNGLYWGNPADDKEAIREVERLRRQGAGFLVVIKPAFWWLKHYSEFHHHLVSKYQAVVNSGELIVFKMQA